MTKKKVLLSVVLSILVLGPLGACWLPYHVSEAGSTEVPVAVVKPGKKPATGRRDTGDLELKFMSLNVAHGGGGGVGQIVRGDGRIHANVQGLGRFIRKHRPDVVALQEADGPSAWSANFDHVMSVARESGLAHAALGRHVDGLKLNYGTALIGHCLSDVVSHTFTPDPPLFTKGYLSALVPWDGVQGEKLRVVSVHLDCLRAEVRRNQVNEMVETFSDADSPLVVLGDFNCEWEGGESAVARLASKLDLKAYRPEADGLETFPVVSKRLDWILISSHLKFRNYRVERCAYTDHDAVIARVGLFHGRER